MIRSMTGYARRESLADWGSLSCELRSVNHRYLDIGFRLPEELRPMEPKLRELIGTHLKRGKVECNVRLRRSETASQIGINKARANQLIDTAESLALNMESPGDLNPLDVLRWPGVVEDPQLDAGPVTAGAIELLEATLLELSEMRQREGGRIDDLINTRSKGIAGQVEVVRGRLPVVQKEIRDRLLGRLSDIAAAADPGRIEQELVIVAQKMDVAEELDRLDGHLAEVRQVLGRKEPAGRRLDFLMQELNREANTLASKSQDRECTHAAVDIKVLIEQMREQIQNVE